MTKNNIIFDNLPIEQMCTLLNINQPHMLMETICKEDWILLLNGKKTNTVFDISKESDGIKGKLSFYMEDDNIKTRVHIRKQEILNTINLDDNELKRLKRGKIITKTINGVKHIVQVDTDINELMTIAFKDMSLPATINNISLANEDKMKLKNGRTIKKGNLRIRINLNKINNLEFEEIKIK